MNEVIEAARRSTRECIAAADDLANYVEKFTRRPLLVLQRKRTNEATM